MEKMETVETETSSELFVDMYAKYVSTNHVDPTKKVFKQFLKDMGKSTKFEDFFTDIKELRRCAREKYPSLCKDVLSEDDFSTNEYIEKVMEEIGSHKSFLITTAVSEQPVNQGVFNSFKTYCEKNNALMLVMPTANTTNTKNSAQISVDPILHYGCVVARDYYLTNNLVVSGMVISAKKINPLLGVPDIVSKHNASVIVQGTKQMRKAVPVMKGKPERIMACTGAVTVANYSTEFAMSRRVSYLANLNHVYGAVLVDIKDNDLVNIRLVRCDVDGSFIDDGNIYKPDGTVGRETEAVLVLGDSHAGAHDEKLFKSLLKAISKREFIKEVVLHDLCNASAVCHHEDNDFVKRTIRTADGTASLQQNIDEVNKYLNRLTEVSDIKVTIVNSNHDDHISKYVKEFKSVKNRDFINMKTSAELFVLLTDDCTKSPLEVLCTNNQPVPLNNQDRINWLKLDESYMYKGIELGNHGHLGSNGARGSLKSTKTACYNAVIGHSHSGAIDGDCMQVGTTSNRDMGYNKGYSSWTNDCALCYSNGTKQLISFIYDGEDYISDLGK